MTEPFKEKSPNTVRVLVAIPNEGHTQVEAYANRLVNFMHMGKLEQESESYEHWMDVVRASVAPGIAEEIEKSYIATKAKYISKPYLHGKKFEFGFMTMGRMFTPIARNEAVKHALAIDADYLFMVDDDMISQDDLFERLYRHDVDIVCPLAFTRNYPHKPVIYVAQEGIDPLTNKDFYHNQSVVSYPRNALVRCDSHGFGAVLIKTEILRKMPQPWFSLTSDTGEDLLFCIQAARKAGAKVYSDTSTKLGHLGHPPNITEEYVDMLRKSNPDWMKTFGIQNEKYEKELVLLGE